MTLPKLIRFSLFTICTLANIQAFCQDTSNYHNLMLLGHWVQYSESEQDSLIYIPNNSPLVDNLSPEKKYAGVSFKSNNVFYQHRWMLCGNDTGPEYEVGNWTLYRLNNNLVLTLKLPGWQANKTYYVIKVTKDKIVLVPNI